MKIMEEMIILIDYNYDDTYDNHFNDDIDKTYDNRYNGDSNDDGGHAVGDDDDPDNASE